MKSLLQELDEKCGDWRVLQCEIQNEILNFSSGVKDYTPNPKDLPEFVQIIMKHGYQPISQDSPFTFRMHTTEHGMKGIDNYTTLYVVREALANPDKAEEIISKIKKEYTKNTMRFNSCVGVSLGYKCYPL
jgi:hypothetical protein